MLNDKIRFMEKPNSLYIRVVNAIKKLVEKQGSDAATRAFADATYLARKGEYLKTRKLREDIGITSISRLLGKRNVGKPPGNDHASIWIKNRKPHTYLYQPYHLDLDQMRKLVEYCDERDLCVNISTWPS